MSFKIFGVENNKPLSKINFDTLMLSVDPTKQQIILNQKIKSNADNSLIGIALSKYALKEVYGLKDNNLEFAYTENGKPYLKNKDNIHFSISHSDFISVCAVNDSPIGIDVEKIRCFNKSMSEKVFGYETTKSILNSSDADREFTKLWTKKESVLKLTGEGIAGIRKDLNFDKYKLHTIFHNNYYITVATYK